MYALDLLVRLLLWLPFSLSLRLGIRPVSAYSSNGVDGRQMSTLRLPVWPVYGGVFAQVFDWLNLKDYSQQVLSFIGMYFAKKPNVLITNLLTYLLIHLL